MCKIAIMPGIDKRETETAWNLSKALEKHMSVFDSDGFGYVALGENGLFGERWLRNKDAFKSKTTPYKREKQIMRGYGGMIEKAENTSNSFGKQSNEVTSIMLHARKATNAICLENTHPFVDKQLKTALIHNGVVDEQMLELKQSSCDSEGILNAYLDFYVNYDLSAIQNLADVLDGYYACGVFSQDENGQWILDIFSDGGATLYATYVPKLDTFVFATKEHYVTQACKDIGIECGEPRNVNSNYAVRHDAISGQVLEIIEFEDLYQAQALQAFQLPRLNDDEVYPGGFINGSVK